MDDALIPDYVRASAALLGVPLDDAQVKRVASHLQRTAAMAALLESVEMPPHDELAEIYCPAAFRPNIHGLEQL